MADLHDVSDPAPLLVEFRDRLPKGAALDLAMGYGRHALYLAAAGWDVHGVERDPDAVSACRREAERRGLSLRIEQADLDAYRIPANAYDLVVVFYFLDRALIPQIRDAIKPGGAIVYETFGIENQRRFGRPRRTDFCFQPGELAAAFAGFRVLASREGLVGGQYVAQLVAIKPEAVGG
ncbi:MAG TPA: class I SAM-dependent methyltransferase [Nitrospiria bacterium]|nr:class I SAM-dependent methyltransferase [Nitrospiria bacterium]